VSESSQNPIDEITVDETNLYREDMFTALKVATIRRLTPIQPDGSDDPARAVLFIGQTTLLSQAGPVPVQCPLEGTSLAEAMQNFPTAVNLAIERMIEEAREYQRQESSRIVIPGRDPSPGKITLG
jgi:hypothetical protein